MMKKKITLNMLLLLIGAAIAISGCYPNDDNSPEDWDLSVTIKNPKFNNYGGITTYAIADTVSHGDKASPVRTYDNNILAAVERNLNNLGWTKTDVGSADVVVFCSAVNTDIYTYWYTYWDPYWDFYYPYYEPIYPYYPYYPSGGLTYSYSEGTIVIQMNYTIPEDLLTAGTKNVPVIWLGIIDGVLNDSQANINTRLNRGIDQCFKDSPYLSGIE